MRCAMHVDVGVSLAGEEVKEGVNEREQIDGKFDIRGSR